MIFDVIFGVFWVGIGDPPPYCDKITVLYGCGFGFKKLGLDQTNQPPNPPRWDKIPTLTKNLLCRLPLRIVDISFFVIIITIIIILIYIYVHVNWPSFFLAHCVNISYSFVHHAELGGVSLNICQTCWISLLPG